MIVTADITPETYVQYQYGAYKRLLNRDVNYGATIGGIYGGLTIFLSVYFYNDMIPGVLVVAYSILFYLLIVYVGKKKLHGYMSKMGDCMYGKWEFRPEESELLIVSSYFTKRFKYNAFTEIYVDNNLIYLMTGAICGFHIPITKDSEDACQEFVAEIKKKCGLG